MKALLSQSPWLDSSATPHNASQLPDALVSANGHAYILRFLAERPGEKIYHELNEAIVTAL
jgi:hypothetical protein